ncbi:MAG: endolytic transglycosylase MltG [Candidatus Paceibacterota bacterium]
MKQKYIFGLFFSVIILLLVVIFYYKFDQSLLTRLSFYLDLANPSVKVVRVEPGLRKEQIAEIVGDKLFWNDLEKEEFLNINIIPETDYQEGRYFPKTYLIGKDENPKEVGELMFQEYEKQIDKIENNKRVQIMNEETALKIASLIQREAAGKHDMALISGIIWNRIWAGMRLQIDATLQYAKGTEEEGWWGKVSPEDKKIKSEYNTYLNKGLPPSPIANPGKDAIYAAYNPEKTECMFYFHDKKRKIHCNKTYEEHKAELKLYY